MTTSELCNIIDDQKKEKQLSQALIRLALNSSYGAFGQHRPKAEEFVTRRLNKPIKEELDMTNTLGNTTSGLYYTNKTDSGEWIKLGTPTELSLTFDNNTINYSAVYDALIAPGIPEPEKITNTDSIMKRIMKNSQLIFSGPATIIIEGDHKAVVKATNETFDVEKGAAMVLLKLYLGDKLFRRLFKEIVFREYLEDYVRQDDVLKLPTDTFLKRGPIIKRVTFRPFLTTIFWSNGDKTVVRMPEEDYDKEKALALALVKALYGENDAYRKALKSLIKKAKGIPLQGSYFDRNGKEQH